MAKSYAIRLIKGISLTTPFGAKLMKRGLGLTLSSDDPHLPYYMANPSVEVSEVGTSAPVGAGTARKKKRRKALREVKVNPSSAHASDKSDPKSDEPDSEPDVDPKDAWTPDSLKAMSKKELSALAELLGLDVYGADRKPDLIARIAETREQEDDA